MSSRRQFVAGLAGTKVAVTGVDAMIYNVPIPEAVIDFVID